MIDDEALSGGSSTVDDGSMMAVVDDPRPPAEDGAIIALTGSFNPPIFHPQWFVKHGLMDAAEADDAEEVQVDEYVSVFEARRFGFEATRRQLTVSSTPASESYLPLADLAAGVFELLSHTPIGRIGMFRFRHLDLGVDGWSKVSRGLADFARWASVLPDPRLERLVLESEWPDTVGEPTIGVVLEPSRLRPGAVYVGFNADYVLSSDDLSGAAEAGEYRVGAQEALEILQDGWRQVLGRSDQLLDEVATWQ